MKKLMIVIFMFIIILGSVEKRNDFSLLNYFSGEYTAYTSNKEDNNAVNLGFCYMNSKPIDKNVVGESIVLENCEISTALKTLKARVVKSEVLEDETVVIYAYTCLISEKINLSGRYVNLQIANKGNRSVIGWPLILGSF